MVRKSLLVLFLRFLRQYAINILILHIYQFDLLLEVTAEGLNFAETHLNPESQRGIKHHALSVKT